MIRQGVVLRRKPVVEAVVPRLRLARQVEVAVEMPLADMTSVVARVSQQRRDSDLLTPDMHRREHGNPVMNSDSIGRPARHESCPRW